MNKKIPVGILGCTGAVGQKFIALLANHPWFTITDLAASENSAGKKYLDQVKWHEATSIPDEIAQLPIKKCDAKLTAKILFSGLDSSIAGEVEEHYAREGHGIISNSKNHRLDEDIPLVIPEINSAHFNLIKMQRQRFNSGGFIVTNPNCSMVVLALALYPIYKQFGLEQIMVTTMQAISGAGYPGIASLDILGNIIPHIHDEEEKIQTEILKIFDNYELKISAMCNRVPVQNGHTMTVSFATKTKPSKEKIINSYNDYPKLDLPSSPEKIIQYFADAYRPQPILDLNNGNGMTVSVGNLRPCNVLDWKFTAFGHNTVRGAAGAAILNAEYLVKNKYL